MPTRVAVVVGGGLVGCLTAIMLARLDRFDRVLVFESRPDPRTRSDDQQTREQQRSINLAISERAIQAFEAIDPELKSRLLSSLVPMKGRMIHLRDGALDSQLYSPTLGQCINSIDRSLLNASLLDEVERTAVEIQFGHKLVQADFDAGNLVFSLANGQTTTVHASFVVGCDGAWSRVREQMKRVVRMDYSQTYVPHSYLELSIPPGPPSADGKEQSTFSLDPHHLHIWPRHEFMLIALPNMDKSFTCTLFAPFDQLEQLKQDPDAAVEYFKTHFADALPLIGQDALLQCFKENVISPLATIQCFPYHYKDKVVIIGDASHSMVPFYGQGVNCGFEDVRLLREQLLSHEADDVATALETYTTSRSPALSAIQQLALSNYDEMASKTLDPFFLLRKKLDGMLTRVLGRDRWCSLYEMVTFRADLMYNQALEKETKQQTILNAALGTMTVSLLGGMVIAASWMYRRSQR